MQLIASTELEKSGLPSAEEKQWRIVSAAMDTVPAEQWIFKTISEVRRVTSVGVPEPIEVVSEVLEPGEVSDAMRSCLAYHLLGCAKEGLCAAFDVSETPGTYVVTVLLSEDGESFTTPERGGPASPEFRGLRESAAGVLVGVALLAVVGTAVWVMRRKRKRGARA